MPSTTKHKPQDAPAQPLTGPEREQAIEESLAEQARIEQECISLQSGIDQAQAELAQLHSDKATRLEAVHQLQVRLAHASELEDSQQAYVELFRGRSGQKELEAFKVARMALDDELEELTESHIFLDDRFVLEVARMERKIQADREEIARQQRKSAALGESRQRLMREHGEQSLQECAALLKDLETSSRECKDAYALADSALKDARAAIVRRLAPWPDLKRRLEAEHPIVADASTEALHAFIALLDILLSYGRKIDTPQFSMPRGIVSFLSEMELEPSALRAVAGGDTTPIASRRDHVSGLLRDYRLTMASEQGVRR